MNTPGEREAQLKKFALAPVIRDTIEVIGSMVRFLCHVTKHTAELAALGGANYELDCETGE